MPYFGPRKYASISTFDIERFRSEMQENIPESVQRARDEKLSKLGASDPKAWLKPLDPGARTINKCLVVLISIGTFACRRKLASGNAARYREAANGRGESRVIEENVLTPQELVRAIDEAVDPYRIPIALSAYCGLREAEALGIQWTDIDWNRGTVEIRRTQRAGVFSKPRSKASLPTVELPAPLLAELKRWRLRCPKSEHDLVCLSVSGLPMQATALLQRGFHPALRVFAKCASHDLRHSWASNLLEAGVDIVSVSKDLGHANVYITLKTYAHAIPKARRGASDRMATLMAQGGYKMETAGSRATVGVERYSGVER